MNFQYEFDVLKRTCRLSEYSGGASCFFFKVSIADIRFNFFAQERRNLEYARNIQVRNLGSCSGQYGYPSSGLHQLSFMTSCALPCL
ncbi:hypothetical protein BDZ94DRAFT_100657 [Collybia nuda]|uniref:Uncharacterized protein n=1 Tax=Collybia nuda TaxID=64659 RepID=A0A9P5XXH3_9AGAR|nr:hypothetical protein BDZ94DRAFT_100657 [Collybia nuda]